MKRFKSRKNNKLLRIIIYLIIIYAFYKFTSNILNNDININDYMKYLISEGYNNQVDRDNSLFNNGIYYLLDNNISLINNSNQERLVNYVNKINTNSSNLIYIYNTHDSEEYKLEYKYDYSIIPNVKIASYVLQEYLNDYNINSYVETNSIKKILNDNNWIYKDSYKASRILLENNNNYKYYIDIHRDSSTYDNTTLNSDGEVYAKFMFVVGLEHQHFEYNLNIANKLSEMLNEKINGISKGVLKKEGLGVNGIYNQDFNKNCILIEVGGVDNNILEVSNSMKVFARVLSEYIESDN